MTLSEAQRRLLHLRVTNNYATRFKANQLDLIEQADAELSLAEISDLGSDIGNLNSGIIPFGDGITIDRTTSPATFTGSGAVQCWPPVEVQSGVYAVWVALNAGTVTFYINASDGKLYAGGGAVVLDETGATVLVGENAENHFKFEASDGLELGYLELTDGGTTTPNRQANMSSYATAENAGTGYASNRIGAVGGNGNSGYIEVRSNPAFTNGVFAYQQPGSNQQGSLHYGDYAGYAAVVAASTTPTAGYTRTIKGGSMGAKGFFVVDAWFSVYNTGGTNINCTFDVTFGGVAILTAVSAATGTSTPRYVPVHLQFIVANQNSASAQVTTSDNNKTTTQGNSAPDVTANTTGNRKASTANTANDNDLVITCTLSTATNSAVDRLGVTMHGPYYAA